MSTTMNKCKRYSLREDLLICQTAVTTTLSLRALTRQLARKLHRTAKGIDTRLKILRGMEPGRSASDNGVRLHGTPGNFFLNRLDGAVPAAPKHKRTLPSNPFDIVDITNGDTITVTINNVSVTAPAETLRTLLGLS